MSDSTQKTPIDLAHLARLARLNIEGDAHQHALADLEQIIAMIDAMQGVDTDGVEPMAHPHDAKARLREDRVTEYVDPTRFQASAPATEDGYYLVPRVIE